MKTEPSYTSVISDKDDKDDVERFDDDDDDDDDDQCREANPKTSPSKTERTCAFMIIVSLTFMFGVIVGQIIQTTDMIPSTSAIATPDTAAAAAAANTTPGITAAATAADEINSCNTTTSAAVSYNFLSTTRGKEVLGGLKQHLEEGGPKQVLEELAKMMDEDDQIAASCHPLAHMLGRKAFNDLGVEGAFGSLIGTPDDNVFRTCNAAYMHGVIEHFLVESADLKEGVGFIDSNLCQKLMKSGTLPSNKWECQHGIGHGVVQHYRKQNNRQTLVDALATCSTTTVNTENCQNGIWMDYFSNTQLTAQLEPSSLQVCNNMAASWACQIYSPTEYILHHPRDYAGAIKFCQAGLPSKPGTCIDGVGGQAAKENMHDFSFVEAACLNAQNPKHQVSCFTHGLSYYTTSSGDLKIPASLCENLTVYKNKCMAKT